MLNPFYQDPGKEVTIYNMDCVAGMNELAEGLYDLIITSPPYCVGKEYETQMTYGEYLKLLSDFYVASYCIIKKGGYAIIVLGDYYTAHSGGGSRVQPMRYLHHIIAERAGWIEKTTRIWQKDFATLTDKFSIQTNLPKDEYEYIVSFKKPGGGREKVREQKYHPRGIWSTAGKKQSTSTLKHHPAAFPEHLVIMILNVYSDEGDTIIDPFGGSGTVPFVAKKMGRKGIMFETNQEYCETSRIRCCQQVADWDGIGEEKQINFLEESNEKSDGQVAGKIPADF